MFGYGEENWEMLDPVHALHVSVAPVILTTDGDQLQVLMKNNFDGPSRGEFVLPHSVLPQDQMIEETAAELMDRHDLGGVKLEQTSTFSFPRIDPRSRVMTVGLLAVLGKEIQHSTRIQTVDALRDFLRSNYRRAVITFAEDRLLNRPQGGSGKSLKQRMPEGWNIGDDPYARYRAVDIEIEGER